MLQLLLYPVAVLAAFSSGTAPANQITIEGCQCSQPCFNVPKYGTNSICFTNSCGKINQTDNFFYGYCKIGSEKSDNNCACSTPCLLDVNSLGKNDAWCQTDSCGTRNATMYWDKCNIAFIQKMSKPQNQYLDKSNGNSANFTVKEISVNNCSCSSSCGLLNSNGRTACLTENKCGTLSDNLGLYFDWCDFQLVTPQNLSIILSKAAQNQSNSATNLTQYNDPLLKMWLVQGPSSADDIPVIYSTGMSSDSGCKCISSCGKSSTTSSAWCKVDGSCSNSQSNGKFYWDSCAKAFLGEYTGSSTSVSPLLMLNLLLALLNFIN